MLTIDSQGIVIDPRVNIKQSWSVNKKKEAVELTSIIPTTPNRKDLGIPLGIVVHQTNSPTASSAYNTMLNSKGVADAHFLIDKDGTIYQTFSLNFRAHHTGSIHSRCIREQNCSEADAAKLNELYKKHWLNKSKIDAIEAKKSPPHSYPSNRDSVGIEVVGEPFAYEKDGTKSKNQDINPDKKIYEPLTEEQKESLEWLIRELSVSFKNEEGAVVRIPMTEIFFHSEISWKNPTEGKPAEESRKRLQEEEAQRNKEAAETVQAEE